MAKDSPRLGRGLNALVGRPTTPSDPTNIETDESPKRIRQISVDAIKPNPRQPRTGFDNAKLQELSDSIRANGILQPIIVRPMADGRFELVAGERRLRAARLVGMHVVPAIVHSLSDAESFEIALIENLQREDLSPLERAAGYQRYLETFKVSVEDLAKRLSESRANIANYLRLLKLRPEIHVMIGAGQLGMGQARAIAGITDPQRQLAIARLAARRNLSVRQVEALARSDARPTPNEPRSPTSADVHHAEVAETLTRAVGLRVTLKPGRKKNSGRIILHYNNLEEFDQIAEKIGGRKTLEP